MVSERACTEVSCVSHYVETGLACFAGMGLMLAYVYNLLLSKLLLISRREKYYLD